MEFANVFFLIPEMTAHHYFAQTFVVVMENVQKLDANV